MEGALRGLWVTSAWEKCREGSGGFAGGRCHPQLGERGGAPRGGEAGWWRWHRGRGSACLEGGGRARPGERAARSRPGCQDREGEPGAAPEESQQGALRGGARALSCRGPGAAGRPSATLPTLVPLGLQAPEERLCLGPWRPPRAQAQQAAFTGSPSH